MNKYNFALNSTLASNSPADPEDTLNVKKKLNQFGFMEMPSYGLDDMPDKPMFDGIKKFQAAKKLKIDGVMKPGGETEKALNKAGQTPVGSRSGYNARKEKPPVKPEIPTNPIHIMPYPNPNPTNPKPNYPVAPPMIGQPVKPPVEGGPKPMPTPMPRPTPRPSPGPIPPKPKDLHEEAEQMQLAMQGEQLLERLAEIAKKDKSMFVVLAQFAGSIGIGKENRPEDIKKLRKILDEYFSKKGEERDLTKSNSGEVDPDLVFDIQRYQKANNLKVDGIIHPGGETEKSMQSHPGKPGPDLPVVMPGPAQPEPEDMSQKCLDLFTEREAKVHEKEEALKDINNWKAQLEEEIDNAKRKTWSTSDTLTVLGGAEAVLLGIGVITGSAAAGAVAAAMAPVLGALAIVEAAELIYNTLYTLSERIEDGKAKVETCDVEIQKYDQLIKQNGCVLP